MNLELFEPLVASVIKDFKIPKFDNDKEGTVGDLQFIL